MIYLGSQHVSVLYSIDIVGNEPYCGCVCCPPKGGRKCSSAPPPRLASTTTGVDEAHISAFKSEIDKILDDTTAPVCPCMLTHFFLPFLPICYLWYCSKRRSNKLRELMKTQNANLQNSGLVWELVYDFTIFKNRGHTHTQVIPTNGLPLFALKTSKPVTVMLGDSPQQQMQMQIQQQLQMQQQQQQFYGGGGLEMGSNQGPQMGPAGAYSNMMPAAQYTTAGMSYPGLQYPQQLQQQQQPQQYGTPHY